MTETELIAAMGGLETCREPLSWGNDRCSFAPGHSGPHGHDLGEITLPKERHTRRQYEDGVSCSCGKEFGHP